MKDNKYSQSNMHLKLVKKTIVPPEKDKLPMYENSLDCQQYSLDWEILPVYTNKIWKLHHICSEK